MRRRRSPVQELSFESSAEPSQIGPARHAARAFAEEHCPHLSQDVALTVSELCTNVVLHAYRDGAAGPMSLTLRLKDGLLVGEVRDAGAGFQPGAYGGGAGMGLWTVAQLTDRVHLARRPSGGTVATFSWNC